MKLAQNQVWKKGGEYIRIVHLERLAVKYKALKKLLTGEGAHHQVSKKEFCRLLKGATLLTHEEVREIWHAEGLEAVPPDEFQQNLTAPADAVYEGVTEKRPIQR
jgi:hypothetical protein